MSWVNDVAFAFSSDTGWTKGTGVTISGGQMNLALQATNPYWTYVKTVAAKSRRRYTFTMTTPDVTTARALHAYVGDDDDNTTEGLDTIQNATGTIVYKWREDESNVMPPVFPSS